MKRKVVRKSGYIAFYSLIQNPHMHSTEFSKISAQHHFMITYQIDFSFNNVNRNKCFSVTLLISKSESGAARISGLDGGH